MSFLGSFACIFAKNFSKDNHVLLALETAGMHDPDYRRPPFPIAWVRKEGKGRVYYNAMGHRDDIWMGERFHRVLAGAIGWATGRADAELDENMSEMTPQAWLCHRAESVDANHSRPVRCDIFTGRPELEEFCKQQELYRTHFLTSGKSIWTSGAERADDDAVHFPKG